MRLLLNQTLPSTCLTPNLSLALIRSLLETVHFVVRRIESSGLGHLSLLLLLLLLLRFLLWLLLWFLLPRGVPLLDASVALDKLLFRVRVAVRGIDPPLDVGVVLLLVLLLVLVLVLLLLLRWRRWLWL